MPPFSPFHSKTKVLGAARLNYMLDGADTAHALANGRGKDAPDLVRVLGHVVVKVVNKTGEFCPVFSVLELSGSIGMKTDKGAISENLTYGIRFHGTKPTGDKDAMVVILTKQAEPDELTTAVIVGPITANVDIKDTSHRWAMPIEGDITKLESFSATLGAIRIVVKPESKGEKFMHVVLTGLPGEQTGHAKELFPAVIYRDFADTSLKTYIICPGGRDENRSIKTVHVLNVEERKVTTSMFGSLPMAMSNFGAVIAPNAYGEPSLVCAPGEVESGTRYPVQRYDFVQKEWTKTDGEQSLTGCPAYVKDGNVIIAGGQSAYYVSAPIQTRAETPQGGVAMYGHIVTPMWTVDAATGAVGTRIPRRALSNTSTSPQPESSLVNNEKRFLKQNFTGIFLERSQNGKSVEFVAVGGMEMLGYQANAVVTYAMDTLGPLVDCQNNPNRRDDKCEIFPDTPLPLGECGAVRVRKRNGVDCDLLVCIGGRYRDENRRFQFHKRPWSLNLANTAEGWRNDLFPELPTPRFNAALSDVVTVTEKILDDDGNVSAS